MRDRRQTDGRATVYSEFTFAKTYSDKQILDRSVSGESLTVPTSELRTKAHVVVVEKAFDHRRHVVHDAVCRRRRRVWTDGRRPCRRHGGRNDPASEGDDRGCRRRRERPATAIDDRSMPAHRPLRRRGLQDEIRVLIRIIAGETAPPHYRNPRNGSR